MQLKKALIQGFRGTRRVTPVVYSSQAMGFSVEANGN